MKFALLAYDLPPNFRLIHRVRYLLSIQIKRYYDVHNNICSVSLISQKENDDKTISYVYVNYICIQFPILRVFCVKAIYCV